MFKLCFRASFDPYHKWFQYRILHRILGTQQFLYKIGLSKSPKCLSCQSNTESLFHLFYSCPNAKHLWVQLEKLIKSATRLVLNFTPRDILLGYSLNSNNSTALSLIVLVTKIYIYHTSRKSARYCINEVTSFIKRTYDEQLLAAKLEFVDEKFNKNWQQLKRIFTN